MSDRTPRGASPRPAISHVVSVFRVEEGCEALVRMLSSSICGLMYHFPSKKVGSKYCNPEGCSPIYHKLPRFWKGFCAAEWFDRSQNAWIPDVLEISESLELDFRGVYKRGQVWRITRAKKDKEKHSPTRGVLEGMLDPTQVAASFDYRPVLLRLFHEERIALDVPNPMPPRLILEVTSNAEVARVAQGEVIPETPQEWERWRADLAARKNGQKNGAY